MHDSVSGTTVVRPYQQEEGDTRDREKEADEKERTTGEVKMEGEQSQPTREPRPQRNRGLPARFRNDITQFLQFDLSRQTEFNGLFENNVF